MAEAVKIDRQDGVACVRLHRPEVLNALDLELAQGLARGTAQLAVDGEVKAVVITGEGKAFCAGGDLGWALDLPEGAAAGFHRLAAAFHHAVTEIRRMDKPVIAAVNGVAAGAGFSLALACDFRVMARGAVLRQAYSSAGLCMDGGGTFTLPRLVGPARALEIATFDPTISAEQAREWGLITRVVDDGQAAAQALALARELMERSLSAFARNKRLLGAACETPLEVQLEAEREGIAACARHPDGQEGLRAFREKRKPVFGGGSQSPAGRRAW